LLPRRGYHQYDLFLRLNARMAYEYRPSGAFDGPVLVVRSDGADGIGHHRQHDLGWSELVTGPITAIEIPTDHFDLMRRPAVEKVGASISTALQSRTVQPSRAG
jgi:thioesterase domain-containing protein